MGKQLNLNLDCGTWGGRRSKSGRTKIHSKGVAHRTREKVNHRLPLHINFKYRINVRNKEALRILKRAVLNSRAKGLKVLHYSLQSNHMHFIVEAVDNRILESGMRSLTVTLAKGFKQGRIQLVRYHLHVLRSLKEAKNAIQYVLFNEQKHSGRKSIYLDGYSSIFMLDARKLAKKAKMTLILSKMKPENFLDQSSCYLSRNALIQLTI